MDDREAMPAYYLQRGMGSSPSGFHLPPRFRQMLSPNPPPPVHSSAIGGGGGPVGSAFQMEHSSSSASPHAINTGGGISGNTGSPSSGPAKRKRGRPRKYGPDGSVALALSPMSSNSARPQPFSGPAEGAATQKRGRGRPPGSGRKQQLASLGEWVLDSAGMGFTPHVIMIAVGEDIATKIMSFSLQGPRAVCILSANGAVSSVTLRQPDSSGGTITYEGSFEILCLSGSYLSIDDSGSRSRSGGLSISVSGPNCGIIGGVICGLLIAASPVQVIVGSFMYGGSKSKNKAKTGQGPSASTAELPDGEKQSTRSTSASPDRNLIPLW